MKVDINISFYFTKTTRSKIGTGGKTTCSEANISFDLISPKLVLSD